MDSAAGGRRCRVAFLVGAVLFTGLRAASAETIKKTFPTGPNPTLILRNYSGNITVKGSDANEIDIEAKPGSSQVDLIVMGREQKVSAETHALRVGLSEKESRMDISVRVPRNSTVRVDSQRGTITIENLDGSATISGISPTVALSQVNGYITVNTVDGPIRLQSSHGHIKVDSIGGDLTFVQVDGPEMRASTNTGRIRYEGDFGDGGTYVLNNYSAPIEILPTADSSFDLTASAVQGVIESTLQFRPTPMGIPFRRIAPGKFLQGRFNGGDSTVEVSSYSGTIRVQGPSPSAAPR